MVLETSWGSGSGWIIVRDVLLIGRWHHEHDRSHTHRRAPTDYDADHVLPHARSSCPDFREAQSTPVRPLRAEPLGARAGTPARNARKRAPKKKPACASAQAGQEKCGSDLLSHTASRAVPSALVGLTSVFGMGTGVTPPI